MLPHEDILKNLNENLNKRKNKFEFNSIPIVPQNPKAKGWMLLKNGQYVKKFVFSLKENLCDFCKNVFQYMEKNIMVDFTISVKKNKVLVILGSNEMITELELKTAKEINYIYNDILEAK